MNTFKSSNDTLFWSESLAEDLRRFLMSRIKCPETAADLTHETYLQLDRRVKENPPDNARALAFRIALNLAIDYQRKVAVRNRYAADMSFESAIEMAANHTTEPERTLIAQQRLTILQKTLHEMPVNCRTAFYMHSIECLTYSEIAARMGLSKSMVNKLLSEAMTYCTLALDK